MRTMRAALLLALLCVFPPPLRGQERFERATRIGSVDSIRSAALDEMRPYLVYTPPSYADSTAAPQRYPVVYLLDGDAHFHSVSGLLQILGTGVNATWAVPEMILVAIPNTNRMRDLTPTHSEVGGDGSPNPGLDDSGGMPAFFDFLRSELIPHVDSTYRTLPYRIFIGHSLGGIATINALYTMPQTFNAYVAIDPSLWWDGRLLLNQARDFFSTANLQGRVLYVAQANTLSPADTTRNIHFESISRFNEIMKAYDRSGLRYAFRYYDGDDHGSVPLIAEYDALRFIFDGYAVSLPRVMDEPELLPAHFRDVSARLGATFQPSSQMLTLLAQFSLSRDTTVAIRFGELRVQTYPEDARGYEFLGDAWAGRDQATARKYYEQALSKNPDNGRIRGKLERLGSGG